MSRADLLALTPEAVAALANVGLVKRAQREIEAGTGPALVEEADGTVVGTFPDGAVTKLVPGKTLRDAPCSCGAATTCRHRVAVALGYKPWHEKNRAASPAGEEAAPPPAAPEAWSPAEIDDAALETAVGKKRLERAQALVKKGLLVDVSHAMPPSARLPSCTVRFLVPRDVAYARCDCAEAAGCEHLALAVWAFRAAKGDGVVALGARAEAGAGREAMEEASSLVRDLVAQGGANAAPMPTRFAKVRSLSRAAGMVWIEAIFEDLEQMLDAYRNRSALYGAARLSSLFVEASARLRAARRAHEGKADLPARYVLGEDEAPETLLDHVRLVSLGARVRADGLLRKAEVFLADPDTAMVLLLEKRWEAVAGETPAPLSSRLMATRLPLGLVSAGQVVSKAVKRRANRTVDLSTSRAGVMSVTPQRGDWAGLPSPVLLRDLEGHAERQRKRPPSFLRPRVLAENVHAIAVGKVVDLVYLTAEQAVIAHLADEAGNHFRATVTHRAVTPNAVDAASKAFSGRVRFVSGELVRGRAGWELDVAAIAGDDLVIPDVSGPVEAPRLQPAGSRAEPDPVREALESATSLLEELGHVGLGSSDVTRSKRTSTSARRLDDVGLASLAARLDALDAALAAGDRGKAADAWLDAGIRAALMTESF